MKIFKISLAFSIILLYSCKNKLDEANWNTQVLTPIAKSSLSMSDLSDDSSLVSNDDNSVSIVYSSELYSVKPLDTLINLEVPLFTREITLESLELGSQTVSDTLVLGEIMEPVLADFNPIAAALFWVTPLPTDQDFPFPIPDFEPTTIDVSDFFKEAVLTQGTLNFSLSNQLQLDITSLDIEIRNTISQTVIYSESFTNIPSGSQVQRTIDLAAQMNGQPIEGELEAEITNVSMNWASDADSTIVFQREEYVAINLGIEDVKVQSADAIFPAQNVIDTRDTVGLLGLDGIELTRALLSDGFVQVTVRSTIPSDLDMVYEIPSATDFDGDTFRFETIAEAAPIGGSVSYDSNFYFDGYYFDLTGDDGTYTNTFYNWITGSIEPTPEPIPLSLDDTLEISLQVKDMEASYVEGYMGNEVYSVGPETENIDLPISVGEGELTFENVKMTVVFENELGIPAAITLSQLTGINAESGNSSSLSPLPGVFKIDAATKVGDSIQPTTSRFEINNAADVFNIFPNQIRYALDVQLNPDGNSGYSNFAYVQNGIKVSLEIEVPLAVNANNLALSDTIDFNQNSTTNPEEIKGGILSFIVYNGFPMYVDFDLYFLDESLTVIDSLVSNDLILAAPVDDDGIVSESRRSKIDFSVPESRLSNILSSKKIVLSAVLDTESGEHYTFYEHYMLDFTLVGDFEYKVSGGGL